MKLFAIALALTAGCHLTKPQRMPGTPEEYAAQFAGSAPVAIKNATDHPICDLELDAMGKYKGEVLHGLHASPIPPGGSVTVKLAPQKYISFELRTCDGHFGTLAYLQVDGAMDVALVKGKNHVNGPASVEMGLDDFSQFKSSQPATTDPNCKGAGDTSAISSTECCSGSITGNSAKHPGPSHCSFPDE